MVLVLNPNLGAGPLAEQRPTDLRRRRQKAMNKICRCPELLQCGHLAVNLVTGLVGIVLCVAGIRLLLIATADDIPPIHVDGVELGSVQLNSYYLVAYERESPDGRKQFHLASTRPLTPEREAALIRYLALEGFLGSFWPEMKERLQEETEWAFRGY